MKTLKTCGDLCRMRISLLATCSAATGFLLAPGHGADSEISVMLGVFLLSCGSSALNQYQERERDARMERTKQRPIPSGTMAPDLALTVSAILIVSGLLLLMYKGGLTAFGLGLTAVLWYNGVYTRLKQKSAFAAVPGALVGAIPPVIGWTAAGGTMTDTRLFALCALFFMWQIPHFWLLALRYGAEYQKAGLPSLTRVLTRRQLARVTFAWILCTAAAALALPLYGMPGSSAARLLLPLAALWLSAGAVKMLLRKTAPAACVAVFRQINFFIFAVMLLLSLDKLMTHGI